MTYINRANVIVFVERSLPHENLADFDLDAIADALIAEHPEMIGQHDLSGFYFATDRVDAFLDEMFSDSGRQERYWAIVAEHDATAVTS